MLALCIIAISLAVVSVALGIFLAVQQHRHFQIWDHVTDKIIAQTQDVVNNHNARLQHMELAAGGVYGPFGYTKSKKA